MRDRDYIEYLAHMLDECRLDEVRTADNPNYQRQLRWIRREFKPMTSSELKELENGLGTTDDFQDSGWLLPDGKLLQMFRTEEHYFTPDGRMLDTSGNDISFSAKRCEHEIIPLPDSYLKRCGIKPDGKSDYPGLSYADPMIPTLLNMGWIRIDGSESAAVQLMQRPTAEQMDRLYDFAEVDWSSKRDFYRHRNGITQFVLDVKGTGFEYDSQDEFRKRMLNDLKNAF